MPNLILITWFDRLLAILERALLKLTEPSLRSLTLSITTDLLRTKSQLIAENALLRQQLIILHRHVNKPRFTQSDRLCLVLLASCVQHWKDTLLIFKLIHFSASIAKGSAYFGPSYHANAGVVPSCRSRQSI
jgi:hypothetical protein